MSQAGGGQRGYTYSPDGRWWWDGQRWLPVYAAPSPAPTPDRRWLIALAVVFVVAAALPLALTAAVFAVRASHLVPSGPDPWVSGPYLAGASETGIERAATSHGLQCGRPPVTFGLGAPPIHTCHRTLGTGVMDVQTIGRADGHVAVVSADVVGFRPEDGPAAVELLQAVARAAVAGADGDAAAAWVSANFDQPGTSQTTVNGVMLRLTVYGPQRSLVVLPVRT